MFTPGHSSHKELFSPGQEAAGARPSRAPQQETRLPQEEGDILKLPPQEKVDPCGQEAQALKIYSILFAVRKYFVDQYLDQF